LLGRKRCRGGDCHDDIDIDCSKFRRKRPQALLRRRPEALFDDEIASFDPAQLCQATLKRFDAGIVGRQVADAIDLAGQLRVGGQRRREQRPGEHADESASIDH
jgi:hypothetical protein